MKEEYLSSDLDHALKALQSGKIILYPTDTIWGIGCDATNGEAVKKIYHVKNREEKKSMIMLVPDQDMIEQYVTGPSQKILLYLSLAQKPTTAIFKNAFNLPREIINEDGSIAIRIARDKFCRELINQLHKPLVSTSANISGEPSPQNFADVSHKIKNGVDYIVQHRRDDLSKHAPSSIIKLGEDNEIEFIRK